VRAADFAQACQHFGTIFYWFPMSQCSLFLFKINFFSHINDEIASSYTIYVLIETILGASNKYGCCIQEEAG
jgi:hypothetical protein